MVDKFGEEIIEEVVEETNSSYSVPVSEQETVVTFRRKEDVMTVWTSDRTVMTKLDKYVGNGAWTKVSSNDWSATYVCNSKKGFGFRTGLGKTSSKDKEED